MTDYADRLDEIRERFLYRLACDLRQIEEIVAGNPSAEQLACLQHVAHKLAGISGSIGFSDISGAALALDREWYPGDDNLAELHDNVQNLLEAARKHLPSN